jgi:hypothetical protein
VQSCPFLGKKEQLHTKNCSGQQKIKTFTQQNNFSRFSTFSKPPVFTGVLKLYLRDGQRATCDRGHAQVARDLGRKLHVFSTEETGVVNIHNKYLQTGLAFPFRISKIRGAPFQTVSPIGQQTEQTKE